MMQAIKEIQEISRDLKATAEELNRAVARAINDTMKSVRAQLGAEVSERSGVKLKLIRERMASLKATVARLEGSVSMIVFNIPAILLDAHQTKTGVFAAGGRFFQSAFIQRTSRGALPMRVFKRKRKERYPILEQGIPIAELAASEADDIAERIDERFLSNLKRHLRILRER